MSKPSVSELLDLLNKPALLYWANKLGLQGTPLNEYYRRSKAEGISLHTQIRRFHYEAVPFQVAEHQANYLNFMRGKEIIDMEQLIETPHFIGRYDVRLRAGEEYICDFKSNTKVYLEQKLQLTAYRMAHPQCRIAVVEIPTFILKPVEIDDFTELENMLKCLAYIWKHYKKYA